ncbi:hypothetical protein GL325_05830 [Aeromicrobium sp. 636]|uniref:Uncharacterized protein n=1 Tax=Aeromicrobium senzhongii TaxID=2663859 RepID=A0A8I0K264_9ACTN|nr:MULTISPECIES: hypothetical protein [Aeromicrobium]MBC9225834.1 hypothetical protein [Aeromicrobium senzhongii]MCQ3997942.1 hypothetical protein [Aeromicrobium sp. 636]MTB87870.1 hypothetical protein [Aeromicrobium senzhongii]QNL95110.1 hypothetical protein H9L21_03980 [Aeromicrobium senzhongii]
MPEVHFDEREDAEAFVAELESQGLAHRLHRDEFAGEDDFEDAAWLVEVEATVPDLHARVERAGGWLVEAPDPSRSVPPPLPEAPRRIKRSPGH